MPDDDVPGDSADAPDVDADLDAPDDTGAVDAPAAKPKAPAVPQQGKAPVIDGEFDADRAKRLIARLRSESDASKAAASAAEARAADILKKAAAALGLAEEDKPDPEKLTAQLEEARTAERQRRTELQVLRLAPGAGADADALLDSTAFLRSIKDLDPTAATFREDVTDAITDHLAKYPRHKAAAAKADDADSEPKPTPKKDAGKSAVDQNGAGSKPRQVTAAELAKMTPQQIVTAQEKGLLADLLGS